MMKYPLKQIFTLAALALLFISSAHGQQAAPTTAQLDAAFVVENYQKMEYNIPMRDGVKLYTAVYIPKDDSQKYPFLMKRTPYSSRPYGVDKYPSLLGPSRFLMRDKYIFVYQDVRGRWMSEGKYDNMRPHIKANVTKAKKDVDESSDTYDTIAFLLKELKGKHNGKFGQWGISYPGFYTIAGAVDGHPALVASSPQAPIGDFFFDDFHHNGAYLQSYWLATAVFGYQKDEPTDKSWYNMVRPEENDMYDFYMNMGPLKNASKYYGEDNEFWQQLVEHPNYDDFWQKRGIIQHVNTVDHATMTVGGWFDAEDLYGPLNIYKGIEKADNGNWNTIVMGPWSHGDWARERGIQAVGNVYFGDSISTFYQKEIEKPFFTYHLKGGDTPDLPDAYMYDTGLRAWKKFDSWPPEEVSPVKMYFGAGGKLSVEQLPKADSPKYSEYVSDPDKPVPYTEDHKMVFTPRKYMSDDQRFASRRPDVLVFQTDPLEEEVTMAGEIMAKLQVATSGTDADWIVKLIDVYPYDHPEFEHNPSNITMKGYQQMVRSEVMRGRFRNSFVEPEPFEPNEVTEVTFPLQDVLHTFKKGHRIMFHIQSTWFPLIDRNPQKYVDNIFKADEEDFIKATMRVYHSPENASYVEVGGKSTTNSVPIEIYKK